MQKRIFFLHIPKTAGMSAHRLLENAAAPYTHLQHAHELSWPAALVWSRFRGCGGHLTFGAAQRLGYDAGYLVTFLRDPVERLLSHVDFSQSPALGNRVDSLQARKNNLRDLLEENEGAFGSFWNAHTFALSSLDYTATPQEHLNSALANLERFDFIGLTEHFGDDAIRLAHCLGSSQTPIPHENRSKRRSRRELLDAETLSWLDRANELDRVLYERAVALRAMRILSPKLFQSTARLSCWPPLRHRMGTGQAEITRVAIHSANQQPQLIAGDEAEVIIHWSAECELPNLTIGFRIEDAVGHYITGTNSSNLTGDTFSGQPGANCSAFRFNANMGPGRYVLTVALHQNVRRVCWLDAATVFEVSPKAVYHREGMVNVDAKFCTARQSAWQPLSETNARRIELHVRELTATPVSIPVRLVNPTDAVLSSDEPSLMFAAYHWLDAIGRIAVFDGHRTRLPGTVWPQSAVSFDLIIAPPPAPGDWILQIRLVQEMVRWHEGPGFEQVTPTDLSFRLEADGGLQRTDATIRNVHTESAGR